jgi:hypothetical protein
MNQFFKGGASIGASFFMPGRAARSAARLNKPYVFAGAPIRMGHFIEQITERTERYG